MDAAPTDFPLVCKKKLRDRFEKNKTACLGWGKKKNNHKNWTKSPKGIEFAIKTRKKKKCETVKNRM